MEIAGQEIALPGKLALLARRLVEGFITGQHKSPYHGFSVEFAENRPYNVGDSLRHINWQLYAKTDKLYTKRFEEETNLRCYLALDVSSSMYYPQPGYGKLHFSVLAAACLAYLLHKQRDACGLVTFTDKIGEMTAVKSTGSHLRLLLANLEGLLAQPPNQAQTNPSQVLHDIAERIHKRSLIVLFTDGLEDPETLDATFEALQHLIHRNHEVLLFHVIERDKEIMLNFEDRPYKFVDLETGEHMKLNPAELRADYQRKTKDYFRKIKERCGQMGVDLVPVDVKEDMRHVLSTYLTKRAKMS